jgi:hypothetical protein
MEICHEAWGNHLIMGIYHPSSNMTLEIPHQKWSAWWLSHPSKKILVNWDYYSQYMG